MTVWVNEVLASPTASSVLWDPGCKVEVSTTPLPRRESGSERQGQYFTLFHTIISYSGIKYFNKSGFVLLCCNYKNKCWLNFIWNCHILFFSSFGKKSVNLFCIMNTNQWQDTWFLSSAKAWSPTCTHFKKHIISISPAMSPITVTFNLLFFFHCCCLNFLELRDPFTP